LRPIVATYKSATTFLAKTVNRLLLSQLPKQQYVFKNSYEALSQLKKVQIKPGYKFMSFDIKSMYTAIPQKDAIDRFKDYCTQNQITSFQYGRDTVDRIDTETMGELVKLCVDDNCFTYDGQIYQQCSGLFMGGSLSPILANIYMQDIDVSVSKHPSVSFYGRYMDDSLLQVKETDINSISTFINGLDPYIKFTHELQVDDSFPFLDILIIVKRNRFDTTVYRKPEYSGITLNFNSYHPFSQKLSVIYGFVHRACKFCSTLSLLNNELKNIKELLLANDYPENLLHKHILQAKKKFLTPPP